MKLNLIIQKHTAWLNKETGGERANLSRADLSGADLRRADLWGADLIKADLRWADLSGANLSRADLIEANLRWANLSGARLRGANLWGANLWGTNLTKTRYSLLAVLQAKWGNMSDTLTTELMRWDASAHPNPEAFQKWADGGACPLSRVDRAFLFKEKRGLFQPGPPAMTLWQLWLALAEENEIKLD